MNEFYVLLEQAKQLYESELFEDVKLICDLLVGLTESSNSEGTVCDAKDKYMIYYLYGNAAFQLKEYKLADSLFNKALLINKSNLRPKPKTQASSDCDTDISIKYNLHLCLMNEKKYQEAFVILDSISSKQRTAKILLALAKLHQQLVNPKEAINTYKELLKTNKFSLIAIEALLSLGVKLDELPKIPSNMSTEWLNTYLKGKSHIVAREYKEAIKSLKVIDTNFGHKSTEVLCSLATSQYLNGEYSNAMGSFEKLHRLQPTFTKKMDVYAYLLYSDKSEYDKVTTLEKLANDMHQVSVSIPETWTVIGYYSLKKKHQKAKCFAENALLIDNENAQALLLRAISLTKLKAISESAVTYREATRINIYFFEAYKGLVETLVNLNHTKDAIQIAGNALKLLGSNHRTLALYGEALSKDPSTQEKSKTYLSKALRGDPDNYETVICLVKVCMALQQYNEALEVLGKYVRYNSQNTKIMHIYSELMKKCGRSDEAIIYMNKVSGMDPSNLQIKSMLERTEQSIEANVDETIQNFHVI